MKEKISRNKISSHYKSFFELDNMALAENDNLMIDWGESLINEFINQEVEKRIAERMPTIEDEERNVFKFSGNRSLSSSYFTGFFDACKWLRSRLTNPGVNDSQKTEGGTK